jgi:transposase
LTLPVKTCWRPRFRSLKPPRIWKRLLGSAHNAGCGHKWREATSEQALASGAEARDRGGDVLPGSSVSIVARQYDVNANQVFRWRRLAEKSGSPTPGVVGRARACDDHPEPEREGATRPAPAHSDTIEIEVGGDCRIRVGSSFDGRALKRVLDVLRKR